jgi:hypothetical protein
LPAQQSVELTEPTELTKRTERMKRDDALFAVQAPFL